MLVLPKNNFKPIIYLILVLPTLLQIVILRVHPANARQVNKNQHLVAQVPGGIIDVLHFFFELSRLVENSRLLNIPFAGHVAFEDQKEIFMISLNEFLKQ